MTLRGIRKIDKRVLKSGNEIVDHLGQEKQARAQASNKKFPISLVVITLNEEDNIERCLKSVSWVDDIVVLDSGSTDRTVELAKSLGARVFVEEWRGYRDQKARAVELAKNDWVLSLDADEALSVELSYEIYQLKDNNQLNKNGYESPRLSYHLGRWIHHGGWYPDKQLRFFDRNHCHWSEGQVHERVVGQNIGQLQNPILHWTFRNLTEQIQTNNEYSSLAAKDLSERNKQFSVFMLVLKPVSKFVETFLWKRGFLDGLAGFIISVGAAYSMFLKWAKLYEMDQIEKSENVKQNTVSNKE